MPPSRGAPTRSAPREHLVAEIRDRLAQLGAPRLQLLLILVLAGTVAFLASVAGLWLGVASMAIRYPIATAAGYLTFLALVRAWIAWQRRSWPDFDAASDLLDLSVDLLVDPDLAVDRGAARPGSGADAHFFAGGRSGGGGAVSDPADVRSGLAAPHGRSDLTPSLDVDELWPVLLAVACALGGLLAVVYVIWTAPLLLAEVALDGAVFAAVYRRLRARDAGHWAATTIRRTWIAAAVLVVFAAGCGVAFELIAPDARSVGDVVRTLTQER